MLFRFLLAATTALLAAVTTTNAQTCSELLAADPELSILKGVVVDTLALDVADTVVFAPIDAAFDFEDDLTLARIATNELFVPQLRQLILNHAVAGRDTPVADGMTTLIGETLGVSMDGEDIDITGFAGDDISVVGTVEGSDCIVHKIDGILTPSWWEVGILDLAASGLDGLRNLTTVFNNLDDDTLSLASAVAAVTVFAPNDDGFAKLGEAMATYLLEEGDDVLQSILFNHLILSKNIDSQQILEGDGTITLGILPPLVLDVTEAADGSIMIGDATIVMADLYANNGIVHVIDNVLLGSVVLPDVPTDAPVAVVAPPPTDAPVAVPPPTDAPVAVPVTDAPVAVAMPAPTDAPVTPMVVDTPPMVDEPTDAPVAAPTDMPVVAVTTDMETEMPVVMETVDEGEVEVDDDEDIPGLSAARPAVAFTWSAAVLAIVALVL